MATTKRDMPEKEGELHQEDTVEQPGDGAALNSGSMWACGHYDRPLIVRVSAAVWDWPDYGPVASSLHPAGPDGTEKNATLFPVTKVWKVEFTNLVPTPPAQQYRLKVRFFNAANQVVDYISVLITLAAGNPIVPATCERSSPGQGTEYPEGV